MHQLIGTFTHRWWALVFIPVYFWAAREERSWSRALRFYVIASVLSFGAEYASTHTGFPYGRYTYETASRGSELFISNVPLFVPITFGAVVWAGRAAARGVARTRTQLILMGAVAATLIDFAIDPMTLRGSEWFLGHLYSYAHGGYYFAIPWSNFGGWLLVSALILSVDQAFEPRFEPHRSVRGAALAVGTGVYFTIIGIATGHDGIPACAALVTVAVAMIARGRVLTRALRSRLGTVRSPV